MELVSLTMKNIRSHTNTVVPFWKLKVAVVIGKRGNNFNASNGTGKSTIPNTIKTAMFGPDSDEDVLKWGEDRGVIKLKFIEGNTLYLIKRVFIRRGEKTKVKLFLKQKNDGVWESLTESGIGSKAKTQEKICDIIKSDEEIYLNTSHVREGEIDSLMRMKASDRRDIFSRPEGLLVYQEAFKVVKRDVTKLNGEFKISAERVNDFKDQYNSRFDSIDTIEDLKNELNEKRKKFTKLKESLSEFEKNRDKQTESESAKKQIKILSDAIDSAEAAVVEIEKKNSDILKKGKIADGEIDNINKKIRKKKGDELTSEKIDVNADHEKIKDKIKQRKLTLSENRELLKHLQRKCDKCGNELTDKQYKKERERLRESIESMSSELEELYEKKQKLKSRLNEVNDSLDEIDDLEEERDNYQTILNAYSDVFNKLEQARINSKAVHDSNIDKINELKKEIVEDGNDEDYEELKEEYDDYSRSIAVFESRIEKQEETNDEKRIELKKFKKLIKHRNKIKKQLKVASLVKNMFAPTGIQSDIISEAVPDLEEYTNDILSKFENSDLQLKIHTEDKKGNDTFDWEVINKGNSVKYRDISSGEKMRVSFAFRIGNSMRCSYTKGCKFDFLIIDEIHALDPEGLEEFVDIIKNLSKIFKHVIVISHLQEIKEYFSTQILVTQKGTDSTVKITRNNTVL